MAGAGFGGGAASARPGAGTRPPAAGPKTAELPGGLDKPHHQPHLENFCDALRGKGSLNGPSEEAFCTEVVAHKVNQSLALAQLLRV